MIDPAKVPDPDVPPRLEVEVARVYEQELSRLAEELHRGLVQDVAGARLWLGSADANSPNGHLRTVFDTVLQAVDNAVASSRRLMRQLQPVPFADSDLAECLRGFIAGLPCDIDVPFPGFEHQAPPKFALWRQQVLCRLLSGLYRDAEQRPLARCELAAESRGTHTLITLTFESHEAPPQDAAQATQQRCDPWLKLLAGSWQNELLATEQGWRERWIVSLPTDELERPDASW